MDAISRTPDPAGGTTNHPYLELEPGRNIFYTEEGEGRPVILIHGWACDGSDWAWLVADLSRDHRTIAIDNRGHGKSSPIEGKYNPRLFASDAAQVIEKLGVDSPTVVGHSMGTIIASTLAVERPELVGALVLVDPVYGVDDEQIAPVLKMIKQAPHSVAAGSFQTFYGPNTPPWLPVWHGRRILATDEAVIRDALIGLYEGDEGIGRRVIGEKYLRRRKAPTLAIYAGASASTAEWDRTLGHGEHDQIYDWPENGHFLHQEDPERFAREIRHWMKSL
jgi:pimeloyl-ACP methyl ester carboxylesterase